MLLSVLKIENCIWRPSFDFYQFRFFHILKILKNPKMKINPSSWYSFESSWREEFKNDSPLHFRYGCFQVMNFYLFFYYFFRYIFTKWQSDYVYTHWKVLISHRDGCINAMNIRKAFLSYLWCLSSAELRIISIPYKRFWQLFGTD